MIVGWRVAAHMRTTMVLDAVDMASWSRGARIDGLRCHSDAGANSGSEGAGNTGLLGRAQEVVGGLGWRSPVVEGLAGSPVQRGGDGGEIGRSLFGEIGALREDGRSRPLVFSLTLVGRCHGLCGSQN
jgi:hypothetical protein